MHRDDSDRPFVLDPDQLPLALCFDDVSVCLHTFFPVKPRHRRHPSATSAAVGVPYRICTRGNFSRLHQESSAIPHRGKRR